MACGLMCGLVLLMAAGCDPPAPSSPLPPAAIEGELGTEKSGELFEGSTTQTVKLRIEGMHCEGCQMLIREKLLDMPGVAQAQVSHAEGQAVVRVADQGPSGQAMADVINSIGDTYRALPVEDTKPVMDP